MPRKRKKKKPQKKPKKVRNWLAVLAHFRKAGPIKDKKKEQSKTKCRGKQDDE